MVNMSARATQWPSSFPFRVGVSTRIRMAGLAASADLSQGWQESVFSPVDELALRVPADLHERNVSEPSIGKRPDRLDEFVDV